MTVVEYGIHLRRIVFRLNTSYLQHEKEIVYKSKLYLQHVHIYSSDMQWCPLHYAGLSPTKKKRLEP
ncbi:unnamed protein product [Prunus brigantina]